MVVTSSRGGRIDICLDLQIKYPNYLRMRLYLGIEPTILGTSEVQVACCLAAGEDLKVLEFGMASCVGSSTMGVGTKKKKSPRGPLMSQ